MSIAGFHQLELLFSGRTDQFSIASAPSPLDELYAHNLGTDRVLHARSAAGDTFDIGDESSIMLRTDLAVQLRERGVGHLMLDNPANNEQETWARTHGMNLVASTLAWNRKLEDKASFHSFMTVHGFRLPAGRVLHTTSDTLDLPATPLIIQVPDSNGGLGTYALERAEELPALMAEKNLRFPLLARECIRTGLVIGVTLIVGTEGTVLSALRVQICQWDPRGQNIFYGIQWLPAGIIPEDRLVDMETDLRRLAAVLREEGFRGLLNFDLIVNKEGVFFIECNPRTSAATPVLSLKRELLHGYDLTELFADAVRGNPLPAGADTIPRSLYAGATVFTDSMGLPYVGKTLQSVQRVGVYARGKDGTFEFRSLETSAFAGNDTRFVYHWVRPGQTLSRTGSMGFTTVHHPLVSITGYSLQITSDGRCVLQWVADMLAGCLAVPESDVRAAAIFPS